MLCGQAPTSLPGALGLDAAASLPGLSQHLLKAQTLTWPNPWSELHLQRWSRSLWKAQ